MAGPWWWDYYIFTETSGKLREYVVDNNILFDNDPFIL